MRLSGTNGRLAFIALACAVVVHASVYPLIWGTSYSNVSLILFALPALTAFVFSAYRVRHSSGHDRVGWGLLAAATICTAILDLTWSLSYRANGDLPYPNWLDVPYILHYPLYIAAIGYLTSPLWRSNDHRWLFDAGALLAVSGGLLWHFVLPLTSDEGSMPATLVAMAYLILDLAFFGTIFSGLYRAQLTVRNSLLLLAGAALAVGDFLFYFWPIAFDSTWTVAMWVFVIAAVTPRELRVELPPLRFARSTFLVYALVSSLAILTAFEMTRGEVDELLVAGILALGMVVGRQVLTLRMALQVQRQETAFREAVLATQSELGLGMMILQNNRIVFANGAAERITGVSAEQLKQAPSVDHLAFPSDRDAWTAWLANPLVPEDTRFARPDGQVVDIEVVARWLNAPGDPRLLLVARDVTQRKQADQALAQAQKLEGLGALAGGVAHDFNNLLSAVIGNVGLLQLGELDEEARETVGNINTAARRGADLTRSLLDFARVQPQRFQVEDLRHCLAETATLARAALPVNVTLDVDAGPFPAPVRANHGQLVQAFLNLVLNARDAVGEQGTVSLRLLFEDADAVVQVSDTGTGMDEATQRRIFEPFFTTKAAGAGTGLGLAISQRTIRDHRGTVSVESQPGVGSTFTVNLPLAAIAKAS